MSERRRTALPSLDSMDFGTPTKKVDNSSLEKFREASKRAYQQFEHDSKKRTGVAKRTDSPIITYRMLEVAPVGFFKGLEEIARVVTSEIINAISSSEAAALIPNHRKDPTNSDLKETIIYVVMSEFDKIDRQSPEVKMLSVIDKDILLAIVINEVIGLGPLEPLWNEKSITEIMCNGPFDIQVEIGGIVRKVPSVTFRDKAHLSDLINKLYSSINKQISPVNPYERGRLHDYSRMFTMHETVAPLGPNFNIRKHSEDFWTPMDIINRGTASPELMEYIGNLIYAGVSTLVIGGTGTGKTTLMSALTGFIPPQSRVITLEENLELKPHPKKLIAAPMECVPGRAGSEQQYSVSMRDLVRSALQMRPEYIIIGEVSDGAAYDLCQALNTGHSGSSTLHANDAYDSIQRLSSLVSQEEFVRGPAVLDLIGSAFDVIIVVDRLNDGSRKISEVVELGRTPIKSPNGQLTLEILPLWDIELEESVTSDNEVQLEATWKQVGELSEYRQKKHRLNLVRRQSWNELLDISTNNIEKKKVED